MSEIHHNILKRASVPTGPKNRWAAFDYLRAFVIVLVLWHHAIMAYTTFAFLNPANPVATFSPVVDTQRWSGFDLSAMLNDTFFMSLLFFVSGLFVWRSLRQKGVGKFLVDRLRRLGIPFAVAVPLLMPVAYYAAVRNVELVYGGRTGYLDFLLGMIRDGFGTAGPLWFVWLLLVFDGLVAVLYMVVHARTGDRGPRAHLLFERPVVFAAALLGLSIAAYMPLIYVFGPLEWIGVGPFQAQASRLLLYLVYFLAGVAVGAYGLDRSVLASRGLLARHWWASLAAGLISFGALIILIGAGTKAPVISSLAFTVACAALVFGTIAFFLRFVKRRIGVFDSLSDNAYGIYIVHYVPVSWLQYWLLGADLSAIAKATLVFAGTLIISWAFTAAVRRIPAVATVI